MIGQRSANAISIGLALLVGGCAAGHDLGKGEGLFESGYQISEVRTGIAYIYARTESAPVRQESIAKAIWDARASKFCGGEAYRGERLRFHLSDGRLKVFAPLYVTELTGYAVCAKVGLSDAEVNEAIARYVEAPR